jgi:MurNAc alpha-1-phosphate uridylyltransferase
MILAAGRGTRLLPLTDTIPKALVEVRGQTLLERHLLRLCDAGIHDVVINLGWHGEQVAERVGSGSSYGLNVIYSNEGNNTLETGGGVHRALPLLGRDPFLVINADIYTDMPLPEVELLDGDLGHLMLVATPDYRSRGDFDLLHGRVAIGATPSLTFSGVAVYRPEFFEDCDAGRFSLAPMLMAAAADNRLCGECYSGMWADVGTPQRLAALNAD